MWLFALAPRVRDDATLETSMGVFCEISPWLGWNVEWQGASVLLAMVFDLKPCTWRSATVVRRQRLSFAITAMFPHVALLIINPGKELVAS